MKEQFDTTLRLDKRNKAMLATINDILEGYVADGYVLTLRQLYYQLVSRDIIPNNDREYAKLSNILKKGRMAGIVDWSAIEDRVRQPKIPYWVRDIRDRMYEFGKDITVKPVALNMQQIREHEPPPNPAKVQDPRAGWYIENFGRVSWELDALPPRELIRLAEEAVQEYLYVPAFNAQLAQEQIDIARLRSFYKTDEDDEEQDD